MDCGAGAAAGLADAAGAPTAAALEVVCCAACVVADDAGATEAAGAAVGALVADGAGTAAAGAGVAAVDAATLTTASVSGVFGLVVELFVCAETVVTGRSSAAVPPEVMVTVRPVSETVESPADPLVAVDVVELVSPEVPEVVPELPLEPPLDAVVVELLDVLVPSAVLLEMLVPEMVVLGPVDVEVSLSVSAEATAPLVLTRTSPALTRHAPAVRWIRVTIGVSSQ